MSKINQTKKNSNKKNNARKGANRKRSFKKDKKELETQEIKQDVKTTSDSKASDLGQGSENDFSWYNAYPQLAQDAGRISFFNPLGTDFDLADTSLASSDPLFAVLKKQSAPGVMALHFAPVFAKSEDFGSQLNIAARNLYSYLRASNSGAKNFEPADLMMYLLAMDSAYMFYAWMVRTYGILALYSPTNKYYPNSVCEAIEVDFENLQCNMANFRGYINLFGAKLGKLCVPSQLSLTHRHQWMCSNIFVDSKTDKAQSYIFNPDYYYCWDEVTSTQGTMLEPTYIAKSNNGKSTLADIIALGDKLVRGLMSSEDVGTISGDILRAYGTSSIYKFGEIADSYQCLPAFSEEVLSQIHNATLLASVDMTSARITQDVTKQAIITAPQIKFTYNAKKGAFENVFTASRIVNVPDSETDAAKVFTATRLSAIATVADKKTSEATTSVTCDLTACGTEVLTGISVVTRKAGDFITAYIDQTLQMSISNNKVMNAGELMSAIMAFRRHPAFYFDINLTSGATKADFIRMQELDNFAVVNHNELARIHEVALLSELTTSSSNWKK